MKNIFESARLQALKSLVRCQKEKRYVNLEINAVLGSNVLNEQDKNLYTALVYGVTEKESLLDYIISPYVSRKYETLDVEVLTALRLGALQLFFFDNIPSHSACDEMVECVKNTRCRSASGFVNGVLRSILREKQKVEERIQNAPDSVKYSMPEWIIDLWRKSYGEEKTLEILKGFDKIPPLVLHTNTLKTTPESLLEKIKASGYRAEIHPLFSHLIRVWDCGGAEKLYGFDTGLFFVQGTAAALAVKELEICKGAKVFDVCACPGGKSFAAALHMENTGAIYSFDIHKSKIPLIDKGAQRLGIDIIKTDVHDAREVFSDTADFIIADVPCSGLGVISKKPDIRKKKKEDIERLPEIQYSILENCAKSVKRGGAVLYSTCTLNRLENEEVTEKFLRENSEFSRKSGFPKTFFPDNNVEDGFFVDILVKDF